MANRHLDRQKLAAAGIGLAVVAFVALNTWGSLDLRSERPVADMLVSSSSHESRGGPGPARLADPPHSFREAS